MDTLILIDGENLRHRLAEVLVRNRRIPNGQKLRKFDVRGFVQEIIPEVKEPEIRYYGAKVKMMGKQKTRRKTLAIIQQKRAWNSVLQQQRVQYVEAGSLQLRVDSSTSNSEYLIEKGVDVSIAVDMMLSALKHRVKRIVLISSDADLLPAVRALKDDKGATVTYVAYEGFILPSLSQFSDKTRIFTDTQILKYFDKLHKNIEGRA